MTEARVERRMMSEGARRPPVLTHVLAGIDHGGGGGAGVEGRGGPVDPVGSRRALHAGGGGGGMGPTHRKRELGWGYQLHCLFQVLSILQAEDTKRTWRSVGSIDETAQVKRPIRSIRATFQDCRASSAVWTTEEQIERPPNPWRICLLDRRQHEPRPPRAPRNLGSNVWIHPPSMAHVTVNLKPRWARLTLLHLTASLVWLRIVSDSGNTDSRPRQARGGPLSLPRRRP